jgi:uncharacterized protein YgfB (UPF0149 family)
MASLPEYQRLVERLNSIDLEIGASELHGVICGLLCAGTADSLVEWFESLFSSQSNEDLLVQEAREMLGQLYQVTHNQLAGDEMNFLPYLPDEDSPIRLRASSLAEWCEGYLYGLGVAEIKESHLDPDLKEMLGDMAEISRMDHERLQAGEESEASLMEIEQYVRVVVLSLHQALNESRGMMNDLQ